jgi:hypothetical protein
METRYTDLTALAQAVKKCGGVADLSAAINVLMKRMPRIPGGDIQHIPREIAVVAVFRSLTELKLGPGDGHRWVLDPVLLQSGGALFVPKCRSCTVRVIPDGWDGFSRWGDAWAAIRHHRECALARCERCTMARSSTTWSVIREAVRLHDDVTAGTGAAGGCLPHAGHRTVVIPGTVLNIV